MGGSDGSLQLYTNFETKSNHGYYSPLYSVKLKENDVSLVDTSFIRKVIISARKQI